MVVQPVVLLGRRLVVLEVVLLGRRLVVWGRGLAGLEKTVVGPLSEVSAPPPAEKRIKKLEE